MIVCRNSDFIVSAKSSYDTFFFIGRANDTSPPSWIWKRKISEFAYMLPYDIQEERDGSILFRATVVISGDTVTRDIFFRLNGTTGIEIEAFSFLGSRSYGGRLYLLSSNSSNSSSSVDDDDPEYIQVYFRDGSYFPTIYRFTETHQCGGANEKVDMTGSFTYESDASDIYTWVNTSYDLDLRTTTQFSAEDLEISQLYFKLEDVEGRYVCNDHKIWCHGVTKTNDSFVCNAHGTCISNNNCTCDPGYIPENECSQYSCFGKGWEEPEVCNFQNGSCDAVDYCNCNNGYFGVECELWTCGGYLFNESYPNTLIDLSPCHGHGECVGFDECLCEENYNASSDCEWTCSGYLRNGEEVCSKHGSCISYNNCSCIDGYRGDKCEYWSCAGIYYDEVSAGKCGGHGSCVKLDVCKCDLGYSSSLSGDNGGFCDQWFCAEYFRNDTNACNGRGNCTEHWKCSCELGYIGDLCETLGFWECWTVSASDNSVCGGSEKGECVSTDKCVCKPGYNSTYTDGPCTIWSCGSYLNNATSEDGICSGRGTCSAPSECTCWGGYENGVQNECETWKCGGEYYDDSLTCSAHGICFSPGICNCTSTLGDQDLHFGYFGEECEINAGKRIVRSTKNILLWYFETKEEYLRDKYHLQIDSEFECSKIIKIDPLYHSSQLFFSDFLRNCTFSSMNEFTRLIGSTQYIKIDISHVSDSAYLDVLQSLDSETRFHVLVLDKPFEIEFLPKTEQLKEIKDKEFTLKSFSYSSEVKKNDESKYVKSSNHPSKESTVCKSRLEISDQCVQIYECYLSDHDSSQFEFYSIGYSPSTSSNDYFYTKFYFPNKEACEEGKVFDEFLQFSGVSCSGSSTYKDNFVMYELCSQNLFSSMLFDSTVVTYFFVTTSPVYLFFVILGICCCCCCFNLVLFYVRKILTDIGILPNPKKFKRYNSFPQTSLDDDDILIKEEIGEDEMEQKKFEEEEELEEVLETTNQNNQKEETKIVGNDDDNDFVLENIESTNQNVQKEETKTVGKDKDDDDFVLEDYVEEKVDNNNTKEENIEEENDVHSTTVQFIGDGENTDTDDSSCSSSISSSSSTNVTENGVSNEKKIDPPQIEKLISNVQETTETELNLLLDEQKQENDDNDHDEILSVYVKPQSTKQDSLIYEGVRSSQSSSFCCSCVTCFMCNFICRYFRLNLFCCCGYFSFPCIFQILKCFIMVLIILAKESLQLWFSSSEFLESSDIDPSNRNYVLLTTLMTFNQYLIWGSILTYVIILWVLIILYVERFHSDPLMFCVAYGSLKEFVYFRVFKTAFLLWFICINLFCYVIKFVYLDEFEKEKSLRDPNFWFSIIFPECLLLFSLWSVLGYNGVSSNSHLKRLKKLWCRGLYRFPVVKIGFGKLGNDVDETLEDFFQLIFLLDKERIIKEILKEKKNEEEEIDDYVDGIEEMFDELEGSEEYGHLSWEMIRGLNKSEILYLKNFFFPSEFGEETYSTVFHHHRIASNKWAMSLLAFPFVCLIRR